MLDKTKPNLRVIDGGKRNYGVPPRPAKKPAPQHDWVGWGWFTLFAVAIGGIWLVLYMSAHP